MDVTEYQRQAMRTANPSLGFESRIQNSALGLAGESGEFCDLVKKAIHHGHAWPQEKAIKELGDILWYVAQACDVMGIDMGDVMQTNIDKLCARYPDGFSTEASIRRIDAPTALQAERADMYMAHPELMG